MWFPSHFLALLPMVKIAWDSYQNNTHTIDSTKLFKIAKLKCTANECKWLTQPLQIWKWSRPYCSTTSQELQTRVVRCAWTWKWRCGGDYRRNRGWKMQCNHCRSPIYISGDFVNTSLFLQNWLHHRCGIAVFGQVWKQFHVVYLHRALAVQQMLRMACIIIINCC